MSVRMNSRKLSMLVRQARAFASQPVFTPRTVFHLFHPVGTLLGQSHHE